MSDSFINGHVAGVNCIKIHSLLPHIGCTVHSNTVICLDIYTSTIKSPSAVQISKSVKQTQSIDKI